MRASSSGARGKRAVPPAPKPRSIAPIGRPSGAVRGLALGKAKAPGQLKKAAGAQSASAFAPAKKLGPPVGGSINPVARTGPMPPVMAAPKLKRGKASA